jgi:WD40 repeat protein
VVDARFDAKGEHIVTASMDGKARVWDAKGCAKQAEICEPLQTLQGHRKEVTSAMFSGDGLRVLTAANDKTVRIWDWEKGTTLAGLEGPSATFGWISRAYFSPAEDRLIATFGGSSAYIWDFAKYEALAPVVLQGHANIVKFAEFNVTGDQVVTASLDKTARVWNLSNSQQVLQLEHAQPVFSAAFDPTGRWIITAAGDTAYIWDASTGEPVRSKPVRTLKGHQSRLFSAFFSPGGDRAVTASIDGTARVWNSETG